MRPMRNKVILFILVALVFSNPAQCFVLKDFQTPESILMDPETGSYYVSNVNGSPFDKDSNGYISKINTSGSIVIQKFIGDQKDGEVLHAPKGLAMIGNTLYVTDIDTLKGFDKDSGKLLFFMDFAPQGAKFLNDLATDPEGYLYMSDMLANRIYRIDPKLGSSEVLVEGPQLGNPNGLMMNPRSKNLMVVTWASGEILEIDHAGNVHVIKESLMSLDGIDSDPSGNLFVSSFQKGEIYKIDNYGRGALMTFASGLQTPADISYDSKNNQLLIPSFEGNTVSTEPIKK